MYIVIVGCGSLGAGLAKELSIIGHDVVIVDKNSSSFKSLGTEFNGMTTLGTGIDEDILKKSGIEQADAFIAVTSTDSVNIMSAQVAKHIFGVEKVIARVFNPEKNYVYKELGIDTICPNTVAATHIKNYIIANDLHVVRSMGYGDAVIVEAFVGGSTAGLNIDKLHMKSKFKIFGVSRGEETMIPEDGFILSEGDLIYAIVRIDALETVKDLLMSFER